MLIHRAASRPTQTPPEAYFTGHVRIDPVMAAPEPARHSALIVSFDPGARTAWHSHSLGQTIHILTGACLAQIDGEAIVMLLPGDTAFFAPGVRHWHGAAPDVAMRHLAIQEAQDGSTADWFEPVSDADYSGPRG